MERKLIKKISQMMISSEPEINNLGEELFMMNYTGQDDIDSLHEEFGHEPIGRRREIQKKMDIILDIDNLLDIL